MAILGAVALIIILLYVLAGFCGYFVYCVIHQQINYYENQVYSQGILLIVVLQELHTKNPPFCLYSFIFLTISRSPTRTTHMQA